jgi:hypothetical protein
MKRNNKLLKIIYLILIILSLEIVWAQHPGFDNGPLSVQKTDSIPQMVFEKRHIDLGKVQKGKNVAFSYTFTNKGKVDLAIDFISGCDCTELDWPVKTFAPGESGTIDVIFLSDKKEVSETVEIDILLKNVHPVTKNPILEIVSYSYEF